MINAKCRMTTPCDDLVIAAVEQFTCLIVDPDDCGEARDVATDALISRVRFHGPQEGIVWIAAPRPLCREMAGNVSGNLAVQNVGDDDLEEDVLGELTNILCGLVAHQLFGADAMVTHDPPNTRFILVGNWERYYDHAWSMHFMVEGHPLLAGVEVN